MWNAQSHQIWQKSRPVAFNLASDIPNDPGAYFLSSKWIILRDKLTNFLQIGNSGLGPNQGCHYFLSVGDILGAISEQLSQVQQTIPSVTGQS